MERVAHGPQIAVGVVDVHKTSRASWVIRIVPALLVLALSFMAAPVRAAPSAHTTRDANGFQPAGSASIVPHEVGTDITPQVVGTGGGTIPVRPAPGGRAIVPSPQNVVRIPAPSSVTPDVTTKTSFVGIANTGWAPSDSNSAGGLKNVLETVNEQFSVYSRSGPPQYSTTFNTWFGQSGSLFDPKVVWDTFGKRFIFEVDTGSSLLISVARQTNGVGRYCNYTFPTLSGYFADYDQLGVDSNGIYFGVNEYPNNGQAFTNEFFYANRAAMESCHTVNYTFWQNLTNPDGSIAFAIVPAVQHTNSGLNTEYLVNSYPGGACQLTLWALTSSASLSNSAINTQCYSPPPPAAQAGSAGTIDTKGLSKNKGVMLGGMGEDGVVPLAVERIRP